VDAGKPLHELSVAEAGWQLRHGGLTSTELTQAALDRIARLDNAIHAFALVTGEQAMAEAGVADAELKTGYDRGPLHGVPYALKDLIDVSGLPTKAGSRLREAHLADKDAAVTTAMRKAGAVLLGKVATYEFGTVGPAFDLAQPPAINPRAPDHITGGSSSGSAAAVAAGFVRLSIGTDSGGSVRSPPCYCGVVGLKPSFGLLPLDGILPLSPSLDHVGIVAASVEDAVLCLDVLSIFENRTVTLGAGVKGLRVAYGRNWSAGDADSEMQAALDHAAQLLGERGALVEEVTLPDYLPFEKCGTSIILAEGYAIHKRDLDASGSSYGRGTFANLSSGKAISTNELAEAFRAKADLTEMMDDIVAKYDALLVATTLAPAPPVSDFRDGKPRWTAMRTFPFNVTGHPALAVPSGISTDGLPLGMQIAARKGNEVMLCRIGYAFETDLNLRFPAITDAPSKTLG
jgi:aspartyl-tRNA(Asn)/glutamyl-tRNA(Gln) amidotransferase subunit A